jgi:arsenite-transporting ATPase
MNILINNNYNWIFVSGKGGVGKTTVSSSIATILSKHKEDVLLISTDPAHSLSDLFSQKFTEEPSLVNEFTNLYCMEYDSEIYIKNKTQLYLNNQFKDFKELQNLFMNIPGIEEAMGYIALMNMVTNFNYSTIIFDTAPTGNTLKLLAYPSLILETVEKINQSTLGTIFQSFIKMIYNVGNNMENMMSKLSDNINKINTYLTDPEHTTFIPVMIPEFLSVWETERLIQTLFKFNIDCTTIIVNQVIIENDDTICNFLKKRKNMQQKYIKIVYDLYNDDDDDILDFSIIKLPLLDEEIRYSKNIIDFANTYLDNTYLDDINQLDIENENMSIIAVDEINQ